MAKYTFNNPLKEALEIQGKRWTLWYLGSNVALAVLAVLALVLGMKVIGIIAAVAAVLAVAYFIGWFGFDLVLEECEE